MRLKIIFFPAVLIVSISLFIGYIWPEYQNVEKVKKEELKSNQKLLEGILIKKKNAKKLVSDLDQNKDKEDFVLRYLPADKKEEDIINGVNYLSTNSGLSLIAVSFEEVKENNSVSENATGTGSAATAAATGYPESRNAKFIKAKINATGKYENIRSFLGSLYRMKMLNDISLLSISKSDQNNMVPSPEGETPAEDLLVVEISADFGYLPNSHDDNELKLASIFSKGSFDFSSFETTERLVSGSSVPNIDMSAVGRSNPFLP